MTDCPYRVWFVLTILAGLRFLLFIFSNRERAPGAASYVVKGGFSAQGTAELSDAGNGTKFVAEFRWYNSGLVRFRMFEADKTRYEVPDVLDAELPAHDEKWDTVAYEGFSSQFTRLTKSSESGDVHITVQHFPFAFRMVRPDTQSETDQRRKNLVIEM